jgi:hypothetical protein
MLELLQACGTVRFSKSVDDNMVTYLILKNLAFPASLKWPQKEDLGSQVVCTSKTLNVLLALGEAVTDLSTLHFPHL